MKTKMIYKGKSNTFLTHGVQYEYFVNIKGFGIHGSGQSKKIVTVTRDNKSLIHLGTYTTIKAFLKDWEVV